MERLNRTKPRQLPGGKGFREINASREVAVGRRGPKNLWTRYVYALRQGRGENMKVFVAGATGAIGRPIVSALVAARYEVVGMTSSEQGLRTRQNGAEGVVVNALDSEAVDAVLWKTRPRMVIEELTSLPKDYTPRASSMPALAKANTPAISRGRVTHPRRCGQPQNGTAS